MADQFDSADRDQGVDGSVRSRRALLAAAATAAAGAAAAMAASAAAPASVLAADPNDLVKNTLNEVSAVTGVTQVSTDTNAFEAAGSGTGVGLLGRTTSPAHAGVVGLAGDAAASSYVTGNFDLDSGVYGYSGNNTGASSGVFGEGPVGVWGVGDYGAYVQGSTVGLFADAWPSGTAIHAHAGSGAAPASVTNTALYATVSTSTNVGLRANGRILFPNRSGRVLFSAGSSSKAVTVSGMTSTHMAFAVLNSNRSGVYVRAVVPATGKITIYLSKAPTASTYVSWLVLG